MNAKESAVSGDVSQRQSKWDALKWFLGIALIALAVAGNNYFAEQSLLYRVIGVLVVAGGGLAILALSIKGQDFLGLLKNARSEMRKIVWPQRQETIQTTVSVVVIVLVVALILWVIDSMLGWLISKIIG